jgi:hypothetical protein
MVLQTFWKCIPFYMYLLVMNFRFSESVDSVHLKLFSIMKKTSYIKEDKQYVHSIFNFC